MLGILLANIGSPAAPTPAAVRQYLAQFLSDPRIVDIPRAIWLPILYGVILRVRPRRSARLYAGIWTDQGSPLIFLTQNLAAALQAQLPLKISQDCLVAAGMRYGEPSIAAALRGLRERGVDRLLIVPLFPQFSGTTTASALDAVFAELRNWKEFAAPRVIRHYFDHPGYLDALQDRLSTAWNDSGRPESLLFSFHGIPESYIQRGDPYAEQCLATATAIANRLGLPRKDWQVAYQSRFGPQKWLRPDTTEVLKTLGRQGVRRLDVVCPGFATDCLETLKEITQEGRELFYEAGGGEYNYIPALNDSQAHVTALMQIIRSELAAIPS